MGMSDDGGHARTNLQDIKLRYIEEAVNMISIVAMLQISF